MIKMIKEGITFENAVDLYIPDYAMNDIELPVLIMQDGQNVLNDGNESLELRNFIENNGIKIAILTINSISEERFNEFCAYEAGPFSVETRGRKVDINPQGALYAKWLTERVIPTIEKEFEIKFTHKYLAGISLGAVISLYTMLEYPDYYDGVISVSGAFDINLERLEEKISSTDLTQKYMYMDYGTEEASENTHRSEMFSLANKRIAQQLREAGANIHLEAYAGHKHRYYYFKPRMQETIKQLF